MSKQEKEPSEVLSEFLKYIEHCRIQYKAARDAVYTEDKRLQDLLHELEFAEDKAERNRVATKFQRSRRERRRQKDEMMRLEQIVELKERDTEYFCKTSMFDHESVVCKCRNDIEKDSGFKFCPYCGNRIKREE